MQQQPVTHVFLQLVVHMGPLLTSFAPVANNEHTTNHCWELLKQDFPTTLLASNSGPSGTTLQQLAQLYGIIRQEHAVSRAAGEGCRRADKQDKLSSATKYKTVTLNWVKFSSVIDSATLPPVYHQLVNSDKAEHLNIICAAVHNHAHHSSAAPTNGIIPVISKETKEMIMTCNTPQTE